MLTAPPARSPGTPAFVIVMQRYAAFVCLRMSGTPYLCCLVTRHAVACRVLSTHRMLGDLPFLAHAGIIPVQPTCSDSPATTCPGARDQHAAVARATACWFRVPCLTANEACRNKKENKIKFQFLILLVGCGFIAKEAHPLSGRGLVGRGLGDITKHTPYTMLGGLGPP